MKRIGVDVGGTFTDFIYVDDDYSYLRNYNTELGRISSNLNQIAKKDLSRIWQSSYKNLLS